MKITACATPSLLILLLSNYAPVVVVNSLSLTEHEDLDRLYEDAHNDDGNGWSVCKPSQTRSSDRCILAPRPPPILRNVACHEAPTDHNFYDEIIDTLSLSEIIYEVIALRESAAKQNKTELVSSLQASVEEPLNYESLQTLVKKNENDM